MILSFVQTKGGTGKTTTAKCVAYSKAFSKHFDSICLVELDPQGTLKDWYEMRSDSAKKKDKTQVVQLLEINHEKVKEKIIKLANENQTLILDVPGESVGKFATHFACALADVVIVPMRASTNDELSFARHILPIIKEITQQNPDKRDSFYILPTFFHPQTKYETINSYFKQIMPPTVQCLGAFLPARGVYENFSRDGLTLNEYSQTVKSNAHQYAQAGKAIADIEAIADSILKTLK